MKLRLAKVLSRAGVTSRRKAEAWILDGRVTVNGKTVTQPATSVDPLKDHIKVDGRLLKPPPPPLYILMNKPKGVVTTLRDPEGRPTVSDLLRGIKARVFPVGRLDYQTEGLLLLTSDGELAHKLLHPRYGWERHYLAKVKGIPKSEDMEKLRKGVYLERGVMARGRVRLQRVLKANAWLEIVLTEGRQREIRRMCEAVGHPVLALRRIRFGPLSLENLPPGGVRRLTEEEVHTLQRALAAADRRMRTGEKERQKRQKT